MSQVIEMDEISYAAFLRSITIFKDVCNDVDIREGIIRQRSNDNFSVLELDLTPIIEEIDMPISSLKNKLDLFKIFQGQDEVVIESNDDSFSISDKFTKITIEKPALEFLDNQFVSEEDRDSIFIMNEDDVLLASNISEQLSERITTITNSFDVGQIQVIFDGDKATICTKTQSKDQYAEIVSGIESEKDITAYSNLSSTPFKIDHDGDINFTMFMADEDKRVCSNRFETSIGDVSVSIYGRSELANDDDDE